MVGVKERENVKLNGKMEKWIERVRRGELLSQREMKGICRRVITILSEESTLQPVFSPVTIVGNLHGQFSDLLELLSLAGDPSQGSTTNYLFLGSYIDRGYHSLETITLLLLFKILFPFRITLLRGNHESRQVTQVYGFYDECLRKHRFSSNDGAEIWRYCCEVFEFLPLGALVDGRIFCVHGGLSPELPTLDSIRVLKRTQEIPSEGGMTDLVWSGPEESLSEEWGVSPRGCGYLFNGKALEKFHRVNNLELTVRGHQLQMEGYSFLFEEKKLVSLWSAPDYCYRCGNWGAFMEIDSGEKRKFILFREVHHLEKIRSLLDAPDPYSV